MKNIKVMVFKSDKKTENKNSEFKPEEQDAILTSSYRVLKNERLKNATKKAIFTLISKITDQELSWVKTAVDSLVESDEEAQNSFIIGEHYFVLN